MRNLIATIIGTAMLLSVAACGSSTSAPSSPGGTLQLVTGSENQVLAPIIQTFASAHHANVQVTYSGSVSQMLSLQQGAPGIDAIWPSSNIWLSLGDTGHKVKYATSIMRSPVVLGVKKPIAQRLHWIGKPVHVSQILAAAEAGKFTYMMTSATQSNSGASAYLGYLNAFAGSPTVLTSAALKQPVLRSKIKRILGTINRSSGSSGWLETLFLKNYALYDGMVNYESVIIDTNKQLVASGRDPLYAIYPVDGLSIADYPLGYVDHGNAAKQKLFKAFQAYMLSPKVQNQLEAQGRRTGILGLGTSGASSTVFNPAWGIDINRPLQPVRFPSASVILQALNLYQSTFRKPSFTVYCLDYSGSMGYTNGGQSQTGEQQLKDSMRSLLTQNIAKTFFLQASPQDRNIVIPFNGGVEAIWHSYGNNPANLQQLDAKVNHLQSGGDTAIFAAVKTAFKQLKQAGYENFQPAIILMTDGQDSGTGTQFPDVKSYIAANHLGGIPVYALLFGAADSSQLTQLTDLTNGKIFDGRMDLVQAFRDAKGFND